MKPIFVVVAQSAQAIGDAGGHYIIGVYMTRETAEAIKKLWLAEHDEDWEDWSVYIQEEVLQ